MDPADTALALGFAAEGLVAKAEVDWFIALHGEQAAYDADWHAIALYNKAMMAHPPHPLAGSYTQKDIDYWEYKKRCDTREPAGLDACTKRIMKLQRLIDCRDMRWRWDQKYDPGAHAGPIAELNNGIRNDQEWIDKKCK